ncbi:MAG: galactose-1-phosphate uridylyltransferase [Desulfurococcales archaeon ex4484_204]|nr:MAG: galactose-1-phosphate uridylyltransferase [Desulfurococcales archaeon ex4484_204]
MGGRPVIELRWDPTLGEWVLVSAIREERPWHPRHACPFCPGGGETGRGWDVLIIENRYPVLKPDPPEPSTHNFYGTQKSIGRCYVVIETPEHGLDDISDLPVEHIVKVVNAVRGKVVEASKQARATYLLWFRNKGEEVGVSLTHPHSQVYVTPFIPSKVLRELSNSLKYWRSTGRCLFCTILRAEVSDDVRVVFRNSSWVAFIPFYAHWPFEVHIYPRRHVQLLTQLSRGEVKGFAEALKTVLCGFKNLFRRPMPYVFALHQAPLRGSYPHYHLHLEIYGMFRSTGLLKYAGGMELGGGNFTYDSTPEANAELLRRALSRCA